MDLGEKEGWEEVGGGERKETAVKTQYIRKKT